MNLEISCTRNEADQQQISRCKEALATSTPSFAQMSKVLAIAASEVRLKILFLLNIENELCPCDLADILEMSVPAISQHIRKIKDAGIISSRREGQTLYYSIINDKNIVLNNILQEIGPDKIAV